MAALEPYIDSATMTIHHDKHHAAYVKGLNEALARQPGPWSNWTVEQLLQDLESLPASLQTPVRNHGGGHYNHSMWWKWIGPPGQAVPTDLQEALSEHFGSWTNFQQKMIEAGMARFGSGWVWLVLDKQGNFAIRSTANQDSPLLDGLEPLLGIDVWEHAYYLKYQNLRKDYLEAVFKVIQWEEVGTLWRKARS
jgi:Fe-Mn family superoxide dismutase